MYQDAVELARRMQVGDSSAFDYWNALMRVHVTRADVAWIVALAMCSLDPKALRAL